MAQKAWTKRSTVPSKVKIARSRMCKVTCTRPAQLKPKPHPNYLHFNYRVYYEGTGRKTSSVPMKN